MTRPQKLALFTLAGLAVLAAITAILLSRVDVKPRFIALASDATGMDVTVGGEASVRILPTPHVTLEDVHFRNPHSEVASVGRADVFVALLPLLHREVRIRTLSLRDVNLDLERDRNGNLNLGRTGGDHAMPAMTLPRISLDNASFKYANLETEREFVAKGCKLTKGRAELGDDDKAAHPAPTSENEGAQNNEKEQPKEGQKEKHRKPDVTILSRLSLTAQLTCTEMHNNMFTGTDVEATIEGKDGVFDFKPATMRILEGKGAGNIHADFTKGVPVYNIHYTVAKLHMDELLKALHSTHGGTGQLDFSTDLTTRGFDASDLTRTAQGQAVLTGSDLTLEMGNLDEKFSRYESSQNFNLIDVGAFFLAGPLGTAVTKGYNFATVLQNTEGNTPVPTLVSHWKIEQGVAHADDVAMATPKNRVAMRGGLDFVNRQFDNVTVALLDDKGCSRVEQKIHGPFAKPEIEQPNVLISLAGPVTRLFKSAKEMVGAKCEPFYTGSVQATPEKK